MADPGTAPPVLTARAAGLRGCRTCGRANPGGADTCLRCGAALRDDPGLQAVWAWLLAGMVVYVPANVYPMLRSCPGAWCMSVDLRRGPGLVRSPRLAA